MSIKVHRAYKLKKGFKLWEVLKDIKVKAEKEVSLVFYVIGNNFVNQYLKGGKRRTELVKEGVFSKDSDKDIFTIIDISFLYQEVSLWLFNKYRNYLLENSKKRSVFDFSVCLNVYENKGSYYLIPYSDELMKMVWNFLKDDSRLEDFSYWNNTDCPNDIDIKEWNKRGRTWEKVFDGGVSLRLDIFSIDLDFTYILMPWDIELLKVEAESRWGKKDKEIDVNLRMNTTTEIE